MPLPDPQELQMMLNLKAALLGIAIASGFYYDVDAQAVKMDANANVEQLLGENQLRPFIVLNVLPETRSYSPALRVDIVTPIEIHFVNEVPDSDDETRMRTFFQGCADVERAIAKDISRGGTAIDTTIVNRTLDTTVQGSQVWAVVAVQVRSRRTYGAP